MASPLPALDALLRHPQAADLLDRHGRAALTGALRDELAEARAARRFGLAPDGVIAAAAARLAALAAVSQRPVFNLTGTVLHTNLGRAILPQAAAEAAAAALAGPTSLEYDLATGRRGERDGHVRGMLCRLTGAEDATVVNNNAAAVLLILAGLAAGREVVVSRGELIEIGGAFRMPDIMAAAGVRLVEVGTTNRTHARDFSAAFGERTALVMRVHQANFAIAGFTAAVPPAELARLARAAGLPFVDDLGSGSLVDLAAYGLPHERTPAESLADGANLACFSGDKLLGGPQAGLIVGDRSLIARLNAHPIKRCVRLDKARLAALESVLRLYLDPARLAARLPTLALLGREAAAIRPLAESLCGVLAACLPSHRVQVAECRSQIGSGALPVDLLPSFAVRIGGAGLDALAARLRRLSTPVIGRLNEGHLWLDCRCFDSAGLATCMAMLQAEL